MLRILGIGLVLFFVGCGPRYVIQNEYIASSQASFKSCVERCKSEQDICQSACNRSYQACLDGAYAKAKAIEIEEQRAYEREYGYYSRDFADFQHEMYQWRREYDALSYDLNYFQRRCDKEKEAYACRKREEIRHYLHRLARERPREPRMPTPPRFESILVNQQSFCSTQCGCEQGYDSCFVGCGGRVIPHKICVENCD